MKSRLEANFVLIFFAICLGCTSAKIARGRKSSPVKDEYESSKVSQRSVANSSTSDEAEKYFSDDDYGDVDLDEIDKVSLRKRCSSCFKASPNCEHTPRQGNPKQSFHFPHKAEKFLRDRTLRDGKWCLLDNEKQMLEPFNGTVAKGDICDPQPTTNRNIMCQNFVTNSTIPKLCVTPSDLSCSSVNKTCEEVPPSIAWESVHFDIGNGCLNPGGRTFYEDKVLSELNNKEDGKKLHHEKCEPFNDELAENRCMIVSVNAVDFSSDIRPRKTCWKPTHLRCDPIIKKCICGGVDTNEIQFQFGNKSNICFLRPTMAWKPGFTCGGRSKSSAMYNGNIICRCRSEYYLPHFNSECKRWWVCKGGQIAPNFVVILLLALFAIY